jgi:hypothetical protein
MESLAHDRVAQQWLRGCLPRGVPVGRRSLLKMASLAGVGWLTPVAELLARADELQGGREPALSIIMLWMAGGPSQLETFDPHPGKKIAGPTKAIETVLSGVQLAAGMERIAQQLDSIAVIRDVVSKEGDHERGTYAVKTGFSPLPVLVHPSLGAICCHHLPAGGTEIPRHVSILPGPWPARGGFLGDQYDAFKMYDPANKVPDVTARVPDDRVIKRSEDLEVVERAFARRRAGRVKATLHPETVQAARRMMTSKQLEAFDVSQETERLRAMYGDTPFGRGCLAARRLIEQGVRCVEVTLDGWDSHANNESVQTARVKDLDPAFAALIHDLKERGLLERTIVMWAGEFGRTPVINPLGGRDHWPGGFSIALAGGGIRGGQVLGETDPEGAKLEWDKGHRLPDVHATILTALGLDPAFENIAPGPRPMKLSEGQPIGALLA